MNSDTSGDDVVEVLGNHKHTFLISSKGSLRFSGYMRSTKEVSSFEDISTGGDAPE